MPELRILRSSLFAFSKAIGHALEQFQVAPFLVEVFIRCILAPRQAGKSRTLAVVALWFAYKRPNVHVLIISAGEDAARRLLAEIRLIATGSELLRGSVVDENLNLLVLSNGSQIRCVPASERQIRGWTVDHLIIDEASLVSNDLFLGAALPTVAAREDADVTLASSAGPASGFFYDFCVKGEGGDETVRTFRWALQDAWWITATVIEALRASMSPIRFAAEMEGIWAEGLASLFPPALLRQITADYPVGTLATLCGPARLLVGSDWGASVDMSTCCAWSRVPVANEQPVFRVELAARWPAGTPLNTVIEDSAASPMHAAIWTSERNGMGEPCTQDLFRRIRRRAVEDGGGRPRGARLIREDVGQPREKKKRKHQTEQGPRGFATKSNAVHTTAPMKAATYSAMRMLADRGQIVISASSQELIRELQMLSVDLLAGGGERIEASGNAHDDLADALMLAMAPYKKEKGIWTTALERFADPHKQRWEPIALDIETVSTPGGIQVPASLTYQSVSGRSLTVDPSAIRDKTTKIGSYVIKP